MSFSEKTWPRMGVTPVTTIGLVHRETRSAAIAVAGQESWAARRAVLNAGRRAGTPAPPSVLPRAGLRDGVNLPLTLSHAGVILVAAAHGFIG